MKMTSEEEVVFLQEELEAVRRELTRCQAECSSTKKLLSRKVREVSSTLLLTNVDCRAKLMQLHLYVRDSG